MEFHLNTGRQRPRDPGSTPSLHFSYTYSVPKGGSSASWSLGLFTRTVEVLELNSLAYLFPFLSFFPPALLRYN